MNRRYLVGLLLGIILSSASTFAQNVSMNSAPAGFQPAYVVGEDTFAIVNLPGVYIFPEMKFKNKKILVLGLGDSGRNSKIKKSRIIITSLYAM